MANLLSHSESKRLYSWWWDSRIRTQNSKWLKENLTDMDSKIKSMIKIIEEDADSFAKRAEMYYRRRPELMSLVEEIYRAYRALAERYDHATGALRQAHRTMAQAFPDLNLDDVDDDDEDYCEGDVGDDVMGGELPPLVELQKRIKEYEALQEEISRLSQENESLKKAANSGNEFEISSLKETISKLETEKEAALLQSKETSERLTNLTAQISITQEQFDKLKQEMQFKLQGLSSAQGRCQELERKNKDLGLQIEKINITLQSEQIQKMSLEKKLKGWSKIEREMERIKEEKRKAEGQNRVCNSVISRLEDDLKKGGERNQSLSLELERIKQRKKEYEEEIKKGGERFVELERINQSLNLELERIKQSNKDYEDKYAEMERINQSLSFQLERVKERERDCEDELKVEIERLNISLQETQLQKMNAEMAKMSLEKAFGESRERIRVLSEERERLQEKIRVLSEERERLEFKMERTNQSLGLELERLKQGQKEFEERERVKIEVEREMERIKGENETLVLKLKERETELNEVKTKAETERIELEREMERVKEEHDNLCFSLRERETKLSEKIGKLEKISVNLQEAHFEKMQAQISHLSIEKNLVEMQERLNLLSLQKEKLEREIDKIREENKKLDEQNHSANAKIILLQDEIIASKDVQRKLEDQASLHAEEKRIIQEELSRIRGDKSDSEWRHFSLTEQIQNINSNVESLQVFIKDLKEGNFELREIIKNHEDIKILHYENLKQLEGVSEKNSVLENSLIVANAELEGLRRENNELEISSEKFEMERTVMVSQIEVMSENIEKLVTKKILLENSLFDANAEIEGLRERFRELDEFCRNLRGQNEKLHTDKRSLLTEVQEISSKLTNLEKRYKELELNHSNLYEEKTQILNQISNLQNMLNQERNTHFETLNLLKSETRVTKETLESEQKRVVIAQNEIFKLERSLNEANEKISKLNSIQKEKEKLSRGIISIKECLKLDKKYDSLQNVKEEILVQLILHEIKLLLSSISESQDERQNQVVEKSLVVTLLEHFGKEVSELRLERSDLKQENEIKSKELQELKGELEFILGQVSDLQDSRRSLQKEIVNLFEENSSLSDKLKDKEGSEEDFNMIITELMSKEILGVVFETLFEERVEENQKLRNEITDLRIRESDLAMCDEEIDKLLGNIKHAIFNASLFKEKVLELVITCESFEISDMVQKEVFKEEIVRRNSYVDELKEKLSKIEVENRRLKVDLNGEFTILGSLQDEVRALEEQTLALAKDNRLRANRHKKEERKVSPSKNSKARPKPTKEEANQTLNPKSELQKLHSTIKSLQKVVRETSMVLDQEHLDFASTLCDAKKQVEILKLKENSDDDVAQVNRLNQKDIQLDLVQHSNSSSPSFSTQNSRRERVLRGGRERQKNVRASGASGNSEMWGFVEGGERESGERKNVRVSGASGNSEMWGFVEGGERETSERKKQNVRSLMMHDIELEYPEIELLERERDVKGKRPSTDQMSEKELGVDNQVVPIKVGTNESYQEWRKTVLAILSSGSQRLTALQTGLNEIKSNVESSEGGNNNFLGQEMEGVKAQIREAEGTILQLTETNNKLLKKVDDFANNSDGDNSSNSNGNSGDLITKSQRKILDRATKVSEKIGRLEAEFEQVQTFILKLEEENTGRNTRNGQRRSRVLLVEYLYGKKRDSRKQRKGPACGCMRTKTQE